jgi:hypothetical protein
MNPFFGRSRPVESTPHVEDFGFAELRGGGSRVLIVPALGGKIAQMELGGHQWLWTSDVTPYSLPDENASYLETADTGGYDECFPTVGSSKVPTWVRGFGGTQLPDHGELWSQTPTIEVRTSPEGHSATTTWMGRRMPYRFTREVRVTPTGDVECDYEATNTGQDRVPFIWSAHPTLNLTSATRIEFPAATRMHVYTQHEIALGVGATDLRWPMVRSSGRLLDMSYPFGVAKRYACKLFLEMREGRAAIIEAGLRCGSTAARGRRSSAASRTRTSRSSRASARPTRSRKHSAHGKMRTGSTPENLVAGLFAGEQSPTSLSRTTRSEADLGLKSEEPAALMIAGRGAVPVETIRDRVCSRQLEAVVECPLDARFVFMNYGRPRIGIGLERSAEVLRSRVRHDATRARA